MLPGVYRGSGAELQAPSRTIVAARAEGLSVFMKKKLAGRAPGSWAEPVELSAETPLPRCAPGSSSKPPGDGGPGSHSTGRNPVIRPCDASAQIDSPNPPLCGSFSCLRV